MKKKIKIAVLSFFILYSCGKKTDQNNRYEYDVLLETEYKNEYKNGKPVKSQIIYSDFYPGYKIPFGVMVYEYDYIYDDMDELIAKKKYEIGIDGNRTLSMVTNYSGNSEEDILLNGSGDTVSYYLSEKNMDGLVIHSVSQRNISEPEFDLFVSGTDIRYTYDTNKNIIEETNTDLITGLSKRTVYYKDTIRSLFSGHDLDITANNNEMPVDTLVTKRFVDGKLEIVYKNIKYENNEKEFRYSPDGELIFSRETFYNGNESVEITIIPEIKRLDSTFYHNDREIKKVSISPDRKFTLFTDYDSLGNVMTEKKYIKFYNTDLFID